MGLFLVATALRDVRVEDVAAVVEGWCSDHFVVCSDAIGNGTADQRNRIEIFAPIRGWTMVMWPSYFLPYVEVAEHLSGSLGTVVSAVSVYDSDCWQQVMIDSGRIVDRYATDPRYLTSDLEPLRVVAPQWEGDPDAVAALLGCNARGVARHYRRNRKSRTFDDWGFVDLWATEGITYANPPAPIAATFALGEDWFDVLNRANGH
jgi:hypothetical protein